MAAHVIAIETRPLAPGEPEAEAILRSAGITHEHRWRCSCGRRSDHWRTSAINVRWGAARHVAAMERSR